MARGTLFTFYFLLSTYDKKAALISQSGFFSLDNAGSDLLSQRERERASV